MQDILMRSKTKKKKNPKPMTKASVHHAHPLEPVRPSFMPPSQPSRDKTAMPKAMGRKKCSTGTLEVDSNFLKLGDVKPEDGHADRIG